MVRVGSARIARSMGLLTLGVAAACGEGSSGPSLVTKVELLNRSVTPVLVKGLPAGVTATSLFSSDDTLPQSPSYIFGGSADGSGLLKNTDGTYTLLVNNEDNFSVSRVTLDETMRPLKGDYVLNSTGGKWRLCSATLATVEEHGFGPLFLTTGESGIDSQTHGVNPFGAANTSQILTAFGKWSAENAVPLPKVAFPGKTIVILGDDDSGTNGGQVVMYVSNTVGDLTTGKTYVLARTDNNIRERDMVVGGNYPIEFRQIENAATAATGAEIEAVGKTKSMMQFGRVEDLDYRKGSAANNREIYFNVTGQPTTGVNADFSRTKYGRVYRLTLDAADPLKGTLSVLLDGDDKSGPMKDMQNVDNIFVGTNYFYTGEDPNGYGDETHDARVYQYNLSTKEVKVVMEVDHRRTTADAAKFNGATTSKFGDWEFGAIIDISSTIGIEDTFLVSLQPHTWRGTRYRGVDGGTLRPTEDQASQMIIVQGLPR